MNIGLALSGGGVKGAVHIGVLQALEEENIKITHISGTSSGSIIATLYSVGYSPKEILNIFNTYCKYVFKPDRIVPLKFLKTLFTGKICLKGFCSGNNLENLVYNYCLKKDIKNISDIKLPLAIPAVSLKDEKVTYYLSKKIDNKYVNAYENYNYYEDICKIVRASCSFPALFSPKVIGNDIFIDGGVSVNTPVNILRKMGAEKVIAVSFDNTPDLRKNYNLIDATLKSFEIMGQNVNKNEILSADVNIIPKVSNSDLVDCSKVILYANLGYITTKNNIDKIRQKITN